jgi:hypothetical protein
MIGMFVVAVVLWIIGDLMDKHELAERAKRRMPLSPPKDRR